jgi:hypothetical protein
MVHREDQAVERIAEQGEPARLLHHAVEEVAVRDQQAPAVGGGVHRFVHDVDPAEGMVDVVARELVVVARHVDHARALARLAQDLLHHVVVRLLPVPAPLQAPAVDDVADQVERVGLVPLEEIEQELGLAAGRAEMHVGNPDGAVPMRGRIVDGLERPRRGGIGKLRRTQRGIHAGAPSDPRMMTTS